MHLHPGLANRAGSSAHERPAYSETQEPYCARQTNLLVFTIDKRRRDLGGRILGNDEKRTDMALFHRNAAVIDSSGGASSLITSTPVPEYVAK